MNSSCSSSSSSSSSYFDDGTSRILDKDAIAVTLVFVGIEFALLIVSILQLFRLRIAAHEQGVAFLSKRLYHLFLLLTMLFRLIDHCIRGMSPCYTVPYGYGIWCFWSRKIVQHLAVTASLLLFGQAMLAWVDYVNFLKTRAADTLLIRYKKSLIVIAVIYTASMIAACIMIVILPNKMAVMVNVTMTLIQCILTIIIGLGLGIYAIKMTVETYKRLLPVMRPRAVWAGFLSSLCAIMLILGPIWLAVLYLPAEISDSTKASSLTVSTVILTLQALPCIIITVIMWPLPKKQTHRSFLIQQRLITDEEKEEGDDEMVSDDRKNKRVSLKGPQEAEMIVEHAVDFDNEQQQQQQFQQEDNDLQTDLTLTPIRQTINTESPQKP